MSFDQYRLFTYGWMALGLITFIYLLKVDAPFGRHNRSGWGPAIDNRLGWIIMEFSVLVSLYVSIRAGGNAISGPVAWMIAFFVAHYVHRSMIFPFLIRTNGKRMPVVIVLSAICFNGMNGFLMGYYFGKFASYPPDWLSSPQFITGALLFLAGMALNIMSDYRLVGLRKPGETGYQIPNGGWFRWVSCPNHLGEIVEWTGFAILTWSLPGLAFVWWTIANLAPRALGHHRWYRQQFSNYPAERKALIPGVI
jgi:steroid 5-alpha-reductase/3-oxo-5-alpha-steroid 4-dehydrogenase 1